MEFSTRKCALLIMKNGKRQIWEGKKCQIKNESKHLEKRKITRTTTFNISTKQRFKD